MKVMNGFDLQGQKIANLADPSTNTDAATKGYVDAVARGLDWKQSVRAATTANGALASAYANGSVIDGVTLATNDRILLKNQTTSSDDGIYTVNASGAPTRAVDAAAGAKFDPGTAVTVTEGTTNGDKVFMITSDASITIGTTAQTWSLLGGSSTYSPGNGISISGGVISFSPGYGMVSDGTGGHVDTSVIASKYSATIGNGSSTSIAITHGLGTQDITVSVRDASTNAGVLVDWVATSTTVVTLSFATAPASNAYRVTVTG